MVTDRLFIAGSFAIYLLAMLLIGLVAYRHTRDIADYLLGGRRLGRWVAALSAGASDMSGWLMLGLPGYAYLAGFEAGWIALGLLIGTSANWYLMAPRLRVATELSGNALTLPVYLEQRFADQTHLLRMTSACFILLFYLFYTSAGLVAGGKLFEAVFGMPYPLAVLAGTLAVLVYTVIGGFLAVCWTDLVQALLMVTALCAAALMALHELGGWTATTSAMAAIRPELIDPLRIENDASLGIIGLVSLLGWGLGYFGQPHILARFMAIRSLPLIPAARRIAITWTGLCLIAALLIGYTGLGLIQPRLTGGDAEKVFIELVTLLFHPIIAGFCLAAILAAIMSTADSQLLVASSALAEDLYRMVARRPMESARQIQLGRYTVVSIAVLAYLLALDPESRVLDLVAHAWAGFGAAFGPLLIGALYLKSMTRAAALGGMLVGGLTVILWARVEGGIFDLYELVPGFLFSSAVILMFSLRRGPKANLAAECASRQAG